MQWNLFYKLVNEITDVKFPDFRKKDKIGNFQTIFPSDNTDWPVIEKNKIGIFQLGE
jgi:hypothetical protein